MELKEIYNIDIFNLTISLLFAEYKEKVYSQKRRSEELIGLINKEIIMCCYYDNDTIIGHISYRKPKPEDVACSVVSVFINEEFRGLGYGKKMLTDFEKYIKEKGLNKIILGARRKKEGFYYSCGFQGEALLQANKNDASKKELKDILIECRLPQNKYVFRNEEIHQYYFDAKDALSNDLLLSKVDNSNDRLGLVVVFSKDI